MGQAVPVDVEPVPPLVEDEFVLAVEDEFELDAALIGTTGSLLAKICCTPLSICTRDESIAAFTAAS